MRFPTLYTFPPLYTQKPAARRVFVFVGLFLFSRSAGSFPAAYGFGLRSGSFLREQPGTHEIPFLSPVVTSSPGRGKSLPRQSVLRIDCQGPTSRTFAGETPLAQARAAAAYPAGRRGVSQSKCPGVGPRRASVGAGAGRTATTATAASGGYRELLLGPRPARRKRQRADVGCRNPISLARESSPTPCDMRSFTPSTPQNSGDPRF